MILKDDEIISQIKLTIDDIKAEAERRMHELDNVTTWKNDKDQQMPDELALDESMVLKLENAECLGDEVDSVHSDDIPEALSEREFVSEIEALAAE